MSSPFTPDFGTSPTHLVGRTALRDEWKTALRTPTDRLRTALLLSPRGTGKTVMLNEIEDLAAAQGMLVVAVDTSTAGVAERIAEQIEIAREIGGSAADILRQPQTELAKSARLSLGFASLGWAAAIPVKPQWSLRRILTHLATASSSNNSAMLLSVDELHAADSDEARRLAADLQHVAKREYLPLCFAGAALPFFRGVMRSDRRLSFFNRCAKPTLPRISKEDAAAFYRLMIAAADGTVTDESVDAMATACGGNAYKMQHIGHIAWLVAEAPQREIGVEAAHEAIDAANRIMYEDVFRPLWEDLTPAERRCLERLADSTEPLHVAELATIEADPDGLSAMLTSLVDAGCVEYDHASGAVSFGHLGDREAIAEAASVSRHLQAADVTARPLGAHPDCGRQMRRVPGRCVLPLGHAGRCRSKR
ncbi:ATP-binding protein [Candidatus Poriferisodalis sp.]|uniref:ATP-binding protein n=1 Tax=Candidatus Poriferisodalis sp. TaxID=3101277 RepID=UPI003B02A34E